MNASRATAAAPLPSIAELVQDQFEKFRAASEGCDLILGCGAHQYALRSIAGLRKIPAVVAVYSPDFIPSSHLLPPGIANPLMSDKPEDHWRLVRQGWNKRFLPAINDCRGSLGLSPVGEAIDHILGEERCAGGARRPAPRHRRDAQVRQDWTVRCRRSPHGHVELSGDAAHHFSGGVKASW